MTLTDTIRPPKDLCSENRDLQARIDQLEHQALNREVSRRDEQVRSMSGEVRDLREQNERLQHQVEQLTKENAMLEHDNQSLQRHIDAQLGSTY